MLSVYFGDMPEAIYNTATYFKNSYRSSWITDPYAVSIIKDVDRSVVVSENVIESPVLGSISPLYHVMDFGREDFKIKVVNSGRIVHNMADLIHESIPYL